MYSTQKVGQVSAVFNTGQIAIRYRTGVNVFGVCRSRVEHAYAGIMAGDWVTFEPSGYMSKNVRRFDRDPAPVLHIDFKARQLVSKQTR